LLEGKRLVGPPADPDPLPFGIEANRASLKLIAEYAYQQKLIPKPVSVDDMFAETRDLLTF
jgi:4,5-dihydroxyphthalate decarboxylase